MREARKTFAVFCSDPTGVHSRLLLGLFGSREEAESYGRGRTEPGAHVSDLTPRRYVPSVADAHRTAERTDLRPLESLTNGQELRLSKVQGGLKLYLGGRAIAHWNGDRFGTGSDRRVAPWDLWSWAFEAILPTIGVTRPLPGTTT